MRISDDTSDLLFRGLFSTIFIGLGLEHLLSDALLQALIPDWIGAKRAASVGAGLLLLAGGGSILLGLKIHLGAAMLGVFLVVVTITVHAPGVAGRYPTHLPDDARWIWQIYQRSNFVKNLCLLGVCIHLVRHRPGRFSLDHYLARRRARA